MKNKLTEDIIRQFHELGERIVIDLGVELVLKGRTTDAKKSKLISQATVVASESGIDIYMPEYWKYVEWGVSAADIPYNPHIRSGNKESKYINALLQWLISKGKGSDDKRTRGIAFAIAATQKKKGNPINKNKLHFISATTMKKQNKWFRELEKIIGKSLNTHITTAFATTDDRIKY